MKATTGVPVLDALLGGGLAEETATMIYGPPFAGKEIFARQFVLAGLRQGTPALLVLTDCTPNRMRAQLTGMDPRYPSYEEKGLVQFVDAYSHAVDAPTDRANTEIVEEVSDLNRLSMLITNAQRKALKRKPHYRFLFDSVSTLMAHTTPQLTFRFLQIIVGRARQAGAISALLLERAMHQDQDVQMIKHLMDGTIEFKAERGKRYLQVEGTELSDGQGWVDYRFDASGLDVTGSVAAGRIR